MTVQITSARLVEILDSIADAIDTGRGDIVRHEIWRLGNDAKPHCFGKRPHTTEMAIERNCQACHYFDWCLSSVGHESNTGEEKETPNHA